MNIFKNFNHEMFGEIRTMTNERGETFFVGKDIAEALGYVKPENAIAVHVDPEDKTTTLIQGTGSNYKSKVVIINESGLYALVLSSKLPQARAFKRWVTSDVLPQIRMDDCAEDESEANELMLKRVSYHALNYSAPFIDMRHWDHIHQQGSYWEGEYEVDDVDWKLCELIARIQYATQQHFFGVLAEKYFDDMNNDVQITGKRHQQRSVDGYNRLPDVFTREDVIKCFGYNSEGSACNKIKRLQDSNLVEKMEEFVQDGHTRIRYRKISNMGI